MSHDELKSLALELSAVLPPPEPADPGERELLQLFRLMDGSRQEATLRYLAAMA